MQTDDIVTRAHLAEDLRLTWEGVREIIPDVEVECHVTFLGYDDVRVTMEHGSDQQGWATVFYGTPEQAGAWLGDLTAALDAPMPDEDALALADARFHKAAAVVKGYDMAGRGDRERGYGIAAARAYDHAASLGLAPRRPVMPSVHELVASLSRRKKVVGYFGGEPVEVKPRGE